MPPFALAAFAAAALAPGGAAQMGAPAPADSEVSAEHRPEALDALLGARDYAALGQRIADVRRQPDLVSDLGWLKARMTEGNSAFVSMLYSRLLWVAASGLPDEPRRNLQQTALMAAAYALAQIRVDGTRCGDRSAPGHRVEQLLTQWNPAVWRLAASLTPAERERIVRVAVAIEAATASRREAAGDVDFLCRGGMEEMTYNLEHGAQKEAPPAPGQFGRTIVLSGDGKYVPSQRPEAEWRKDASALRAGLPAEIARLIEAAAAPPPSGAK